jgi:excisionase family DNA binding protein
MTPFVTIEALAEHFNVSDSTARQWVRRGHIPKTAYIKIGGIYRFDLDKVVEALTNAPKQLELDLES